MAVLERGYRAYEGPLTPTRTRFLVVTRDAMSDVARGRFFWTAALAAYIPILVAAILIYLHHNAAAILTFRIDVKQLLPIDGAFFLRFMQIQSLLFGFLAALLAGPGLVSSDLVGNGLPLYLARPFTRSEYVLGKGTVLFFLLSCVTWIPLLLLFGFQAQLGGAHWLAENYRIGPAILAGTLAWIVVLTLVTLAISAYTRRKAVAQAALFGGFALSSALGGVINASLDTTMGSLLSIGEVIESTWAALFGLPARSDVPPLFGWFALAAFAAVASWMLSRKLRAYEVVR